MSQTKAQLIDPVDLSIVTADLADDAVTAAKLASNAVVNASVDASAAIAGTKISPNFGSQNTTTTGIGAFGELQVTSTAPKITFFDSDTNPDFEIRNLNGVLHFKDVSSTTVRMQINADGHVDVAGNLDVGAGLDVTGAITASTSITASGNLTTNGNFTVSGTNPNIFLTDTDNDSDYRISNSNGVLEFRDITNTTNRLEITSDGKVNFGSVARVEADGTFKAPHGSASTPAYNFLNDNDNGMFRATTNTIGFSTAGSERARIDSSGRLLVGTTDTPSKLVADTDFCVVRSSSDPTINLLLGSSSSITQLYRILIDDSDSDKLQIRSGDTARVTMTTGGFVGIGQTNPSQPLHVASTTNPAILARNDSGGTGIRMQTDAGSACSLSFSDLDAHNQGLILYHHADNRMQFNTNGSEAMRIDSSGRLLLGTSTARAVGGESNPVLHIEGSGNTSNSWVNITRFQSTTAGPNLQFAKARSNTPGTYTLVQSGDTLGTISFLGADGTDMANYAARISAQVDGTAASNDMPGRLVFSTTPDGSGASLERMRIDNDGKVGIGNTGPTNVFDGAGLKIEKYQQRNTSYASPDGYYGASLGEVTNSATKVWATVESHYAQANAVSAGIFLKAFHQDAGGSQAGFTIKNLKSTNDLTFSRVTTAASTGNPAVETERLRIRHNGGISFGGETADANALDDYEEGTWTPDIFNAGSTSNWTAKDGNYQKVGNTVTVWFRCDGGTSPRSGASGGHLTITGLPFTLNGMDANTVLGIGAANFVTSGSEDCNVSTAGSGNPFIRQGGSNEAEQCNYFSAVFSYLTTQ